MLNKKSLNFIKNFSYLIISNLISMTISTIVVLVFPKVLGVNEYGYWQLYLFYSSYVGLFHFGWNDGIYLRYGGYKYEKLNKNVFYSQFIMLNAFQITLLFIIFGLVELFVTDTNRMFVLYMTALCMVVMNIRYMLLFILQATYRIKEQSIVTIIESIIYLLLIVFFIIFKINKLEYFIYADIIGKYLSLLIAIFYCKDFVLNKITTFKLNIKETFENISVGSKLMFSNIANKLVLGVVRFGIERSWSVVIFGKISLILSISNFLMTFINAIGLVMFPLLRRSNKENLPKVYIMIRDLLMILLLGALIIYYPLKEILVIWLPQYTDSFIYMTLLFPIIVFEGKTSLLINTFLKTLRKEKILLNLNIVSLIISTLLTIITTIIIKDLNLTVLSILIVLAIRSILGEIYLSNVLKISVIKDIFYEFIITIIFIVLSYLFDIWEIIIIYILIYIFYLFIKRKDIYNSIYILKDILIK